VNPETNGHRPVVSLDDDAVVARLIVCGALHDEPDALDALAARRSDLDVPALALVAEVAAAVYADLMNPANLNAVLHGRTR
jgi:hypothetical protein